MPPQLPPAQEAVALCGPLLVEDYIIARPFCQPDICVHFDENFNIYIERAIEPMFCTNDPTAKQTFHLCLTAPLNFHDSH